MHREGTSSSRSTEKQAPSLPKKVGDFLFGLLFVLGLLSLPEERVGMLGGKIKPSMKKSILRERDSVLMLGVEPRALYTG